MAFVVPMFESERGSGSKIDGYAGPFESEDAASAFVDAYNAKHCPPGPTPNWYIKALGPVVHRGQECGYKPTT